ncbi:MAG: M61 family metallopeptidase [Pirellula sp.]
MQSTTPNHSGSDLRNSNLEWLSRTSGGWLVRALLVACWLVAWIPENRLSAQTTSAQAPSSEAYSDKDAIYYRLDFKEAANHRVWVHATFPTNGAKELRLMMPVWTPGSYMVREYARQIESIQAFNEEGPLKTTKVDKNHWIVSCEKTDRVTVSYGLYGREMGVRTNWIEEHFAFVTGAATFLIPEDALERKCVLECDPLDTWTQIATSLEASPKSPWVRTAKNFDELVDSPLVLGNIDIQTQEISGVPHYLATVPHEGWDTQKAMADAAKIIKIEQEFWGEVPYKQYWFLNLLTEAGGGLEHDNSTVLMASRWTQKQRSKYVDWLGLVSHEFFHTWNVRRLRPKALMKYDYNQEQYIEELWIAEGLTSYYDDLFVARSGLSTPKEYLERVSKSIQTVQNSPGRQVQNLRESSFDSWIKFYRPDENATNSRISYYVKGSILGMLLDAQIRLRSSDKHSLDDCMRLLWQRHRATGYGNEDFSKIVQELTDKSLGVWLEEQLLSTEELDYQPLLDAYGLMWKPKEAPKEAVDGNSGGANSASPAHIGLELSNAAGKTQVDKVLRGAAGSIAGVQVGDELIALGGYRIGAEQWADRVGMLQLGEQTSILVSRRGKILELPLKIDPAAHPASTPSWNLVRVEKPTEEQEKRWKSWLGLPNQESQEQQATGDK